MRLSLVPLLVGAVVRPCVCPFPCVPVTWQSHQLNGSTQYHWVMIHCIWDVRSECNRVNSQLPTACRYTHALRTHCYCSVILILITFSIAYCVQGLKTKNTSSVFLAW